MLLWGFLQDSLIWPAIRSYASKRFFQDSVVWRRGRDSTPLSRSDTKMRCRERCLWKNAVPNKKKKSKRRGRDSNPGYSLSTVQRFSKPPPSTTRPPLHKNYEVIFMDLDPDLSGERSYFQRDGSRPRPFGGEIFK